MAKRKVSSAADTVEVQEVNVPSQPFWEKYQHLLLYGLGALGVLVLGWWGYKTLVAEPAQKEALETIWHAQQQFERDSFKLALENPGGGFDGFLTVIDKYGSTPAGNTAKYYAGVCYLHMGMFDDAIRYMEDFDADGSLLPALKYGVLGDCYSEKKDLDQAAKYYEKASDTGGNEVVCSYYLKKLGMLYEYKGDKAAAYKAYERLRRDFPMQNSQDWRDIDKYIYRTGEVK